MIEIGEIKARRSWEYDQELLYTYVIRITIVGKNIKAIPKRESILFSTLILKIENALKEKVEADWSKTWREVTSEDSWKQEIYTYSYNVSSSWAILNKTINTLQHFFKQGA